MMRCIDVDDDHDVVGDEEENGDQCIYHELPSHPAPALLPPCIIIIIVIIFIIYFVIASVVITINYHNEHHRHRHHYIFHPDTSGCLGHDLFSMSALKINAS